MNKIFCVFFFLFSFFSSVAFAAIDGGYNQGLYIQTPDTKYKLLFNFLLQPQYQHLTISDQGDTNTFQIRRARVYFMGNVVDPKLTYRLELEVVGGQTFTVSPGQHYNGPNLKDAFIIYTFNQAIGVEVGQFKVYFNREELSYSSHLQFVDYSLTNEVFSYHRNIGAAVRGYPWNKKMEYAAFIMNDGSDQNTQNRDNMFLVGGRILYSPIGRNIYMMGDLDYSESEITHSKTPNLSFAVSSVYNHARVNQSSPSQKISSTTWDVAYRYNGISAMGIGYYVDNLSTKLDTFGFLSQAGFFLIPKHFEIAGRYAGVIPTSPTVPNGYEVGVTFNYYFWAQTFKLQADFNELINSPLVYGANGSSGVSLPNNIVTTGQTPGFQQGQHNQQARLQMQLFF